MAEESWHEPARSYVEDQRRRRAGAGAPLPRCSPSFRHSASSAGLAAVVRANAAGGFSVRSLSVVASWAARPGHSTLTARGLIA